MHFQGLEDEKAALRADQKALCREHQELLQAKAAWDARLQEQQARCRDVQLLKFGREIDTSLLDSIGARNLAAEDLRLALQQQVRARASWALAFAVAAGAGSVGAAAAMLSLCDRRAPPNSVPSVRDPARNDRSAHKSASWVTSRPKRARKRVSCGA
jgi:hypothetical protein